MEHLFVRTVQTLHKFNQPSDASGARPALLLFVERQVDGASPQGIWSIERCAFIFFVAEGPGLDFFGRKVPFWVIFADLLIVLRY
jgi:hypothetical protein